MIQIGWLILFFRILVAFDLTFSFNQNQKLNECDQLFLSNDGPKNGTFSSPILSNQANHSKQCMYTFIGNKNERVQISFTKFQLREVFPECTNEYLDFYTELEDLNQDLISSPFGGRYCHHILPPLHVSLYSILILNFHTQMPSVSDQIFQGTYQFIEQISFIAGTPAPNQICSFTIFSYKKKEGQFLSPTYPGVYNKNLKCQYRFFGEKDQRVRIEFLDFDLFSGGFHCPFDQVLVYDGSNITDPLIGTYCGQQRNLVIYSSGENLLVLFNTLERNLVIENRGFLGWFEFSERFVNLGFIVKNDAEHILGTECDQKILSQKENNGTIFSPNYPFLYHSNIVCKYYIYGIENEQHLERVKMEFEKFEIPNNYNFITTSDLSISVTGSSKNEECGDAFVQIYLTPQTSSEPDYILCGINIQTPLLVSKGPALIIIFNSGSTQGHGFKAKYWFENDFRIPGTPEPPGCRFKYFSTAKKSGTFNSPRHPRKYPSSTYCEYIFIALPMEHIKIFFNHFKFKTKSPIKIGYNEACVEDWIEIYEVYLSGKEYKIGRYCANSAPGPFVTNQGIHQLKIILSTDETGMSSGFLASYYFMSDDNLMKDCGENFTNITFGYIRSLNFPHKYTSKHLECKWLITVKPNHRVLLHFPFFLIEGDLAGRGCPSAVVRVTSDLSKPVIELCGADLSNDTREILSSSNILKISFLVTDKAVGSDGFEAVWTEVRKESSCDMLQCSKSGYCISEELRCNNVLNCGHLDTSDEMNCVQINEVNKLMMISMVSVGLLLLIIILCSLGYRKRKRRSSNSSQNQYEVSRPKISLELGSANISVDNV